MSQEELAHVVGVSDGMVSQWENGKASPRRPKALKLDEALGAAGAILDAFGYGVVTNVEDQIVRLTEMVTRLAAQVADLAARVDQQDAKRR